MVRVLRCSFLEQTFQEESLVDALFWGSMGSKFKTWSRMRTPWHNPTGSGEKRRPETGSDASARPTTSDTTKRAKSSRESSPAVPRAHSMSPAPSDPRSCPKRSVVCGLVTGKSFLLVVSTWLSWPYLERFSGDSETFMGVSVMMFNVAVSSLVWPGHFH